MGDDDVGIALHHQYGLGLALMDGLLGQIEAIEQFALVENGRFRRVDVFAGHECLDIGEQAAAQAEKMEAK